MDPIYYQELVNCLGGTNLGRCSTSPAQAQSFESFEYKKSIPARKPRVPALYELGTSEQCVLARLRVSASGFHGPTRPHPVIADNSNTMSTPALNFVAVCGNANLPVNGT